MFINIKFEDEIGMLNTNTNEVYFYHFKYCSIIEAIHNLNNDKNNNAETINILNKLIPHVVKVEDS